MAAADGCPVCGRPLEHWIDGSTQGAYCPPCRRWHVVTTYMPPILSDRRVYRILLDPVVRPPVVRPNAVQVRAIARLLGVSFPEAKRAAVGTTVVFTGRAKAALPVLAALDEARLPVTVDPPFPWTAADAWEIVTAMGPRPAPTWRRSRPG